MPNRAQRTRGRQFHQHLGPKKDMLLLLLLINPHKCSRKHSSIIAKALMSMAVRPFLSRGPKTNNNIYCL